MSAFERFVNAENAEEMERAVEAAGGRRALADSAFDDIKKMLGELCNGIRQMAEYVKDNAYHRQLINIGDVRLNITLDAGGERIAEINVRPNDGMKEFLVELRKEMEEA